MNCLKYCSEILGVLLFISWAAYAEESTSTYASNNSSELVHTSAASSDTSFESSPSTVSVMSLEKTETSSVKIATSVSPPPRPIQTTTAPSTQFLKRECLQVTLVSGGLIIICFSLLITVLLLTWKVCQLRRKLRMMSSSSELWVETDTKKQSKPEAEAKETTVLMADLSQTKQEMENGSAKEDGGKVNEDGQETETAKEEKDEDSPKEEEKEAAVAVESSSSLKPEEEAGSSQPTADAAASSSEGTEEPKDVP